MSCVDFLISVSLLASDWLYFDLTLPMRARVRWVLYRKILLILNFFIEFRRLFNSKLL